MELEQKPDQRPLAFLGGNGIGTKLRKAMLHREPVKPPLPVRFQQLRNFVDGQVVPVAGDQIHIFHGLSSLLLRSGPISRPARFTFLP